MEQLENDRPALQTRYSQDTVASFDSCEWDIYNNARTRFRERDTPMRVFGYNRIESTGSVRAVLFCFGISPHCGAQSFGGGEASAV